MVEFQRRLDPFCKRIISVCTLECGQTGYSAKMSLIVTYGCLGANISSVL